MATIKCKYRTPCVKLAITDPDYSICSTLNHKLLFYKNENLRIH